MTKLLVSVRDAREAEAAIAGGADVVDVKEPHRGPLGSALPTTWQAVADVIPAKTPLSVALGELAAFDPDQTAFLPLRCVWAKLGLAGIAHDDWRDRWRDAARTLPPGTTLVAVAYADWNDVAAPPPEDVLEQLATQSTVLLLDTGTKDGRNLLHWYDPTRLARLARSCRHLGVRLALAGSLGPEQLPAILQVAPDWIAVRGAACDGGREGTVVAGRVRALKGRLDALRRQPPRISTPMPT